MKPVLYSSTETEFTSNGLGVLNDTVSAVVLEERNGAYELTMEYPADEYTSPTFLLGVLS